MTSPLVFTPTVKWPNSLHSKYAVFLEMPGGYLGVPLDGPTCSKLVQFVLFEEGRATYLVCSQREGAGFVPARLIYLCTNGHGMIQTLIL